MFGPTTPDFNYRPELQTAQDRDDYCDGAAAMLQSNLSHDEQDVQAGEASYEYMSRAGFCPAMIRDVAESIKNRSQLAAQAIFDRLEK